MVTIIKMRKMAGREVFVTKVGSPDRATRKLSDVGIQESFLTNAYRLSPNTYLEPGALLA
jgi:hypothetical protein